MASRLAPVPIPETQRYWDAAAKGRLELPRCRGCEHHYFPPSPVCPHCTSRDVAWEQVSGRARLLSFVITERPWPDWDTDGPMSVALVELEEGPRLVSTIVDCRQDPDTLTTGMELAITFREFAGTQLPCFAPVEERP